MKKRNLILLICAFVCTPLTYATPSPSVQAEGAILIEPHTQTVLYRKNIHSTFYPASTTKVLTSLLLVEDMQEGATITKSQDSLINVPSDSSHIGLKVGDSYSYTDGLHAILMGSDNFVSYDMSIFNASSINAFADKMNAKAKSLGANASHFVNPHGYHDPNHYTTPYDLALITSAAFDNPTLAQISGTPTYNFNILNTGTVLPLKHTAQFFNPSSPYYNKQVLAAKTGYHTPAGRTLVAKAQYGDLELVAVVMKSGYPTYFEDINTLFEYGAQNFEFLSDAQHNVGVKNISYSDWGHPYINHALSNKWITPSAKSYMDAATGMDWLQMVEHMFPYPLKPLLADYLVPTSTFSYQLNHPLSRTESAKLFKSLGVLLNLSPSHIQEGINFIQSPEKTASLTLEEYAYLTQFIGHSILTDRVITH
ncbi:MAG: hypothetical protein RR448_04265 [Niameybacter sp.]|uniref:D-alanyl-D-alanine carboxypeptidase family protein n=1 Tax=Niameybacter sp. TaxID=2033640 RepID=UPI002FC6E17C